MSLFEKIEKISSRRRFGMRPGLDRISSLLGALSNPERDLVCIHVAGTNGKGSVAATIAAVLQHAGFGSVGLYTSPHLVSFNERIRIDGVPISDAALEAAIDETLAADDGTPTFFELATATAFVAYRAAGVRLAVIEAGLGGRLDATNVIIPAVSVITNVGLEHCQWLGPDIPTIAGEKAGIVKPGRPIVTGAMDEAALAVIARRAAEVGAPMPQPEVSVTMRKAKDGTTRISFEDGFRALSSIRFALTGDYQRENLATALAALEVFSQTTGLPLTDDAFKEGLETVSWPCRYQVVRQSPRTIADGAHNPPAAEALARSLAAEKAPLALVAGICADKDASRFLRTLKPRFKAAFATETPNERTMPAAEAAAIMRQAGFNVMGAEPDWRRALDAATAWAEANGGAIVVCGSLFLAGAVADSFGALPWESSVPSPNERL